MTMRDYSELVKALRACGDHFDCENCPIDKPESTSDDCHKVDLDAADAIEELVARNQEQEYVIRLLHIEKETLKTFFGR